ncbi:hypothetical protein ASD11_15760 [Aeromicrobium sp. Root495]|uniref:transglycosylase domain-containing protein n=1 Tax=Aeromicrobium sp. Root495 TaxID=1736550 RepID=UPI0006F86291|nr:transglycosylase domain-containing protein [Aeromicrobium sp. Root495]KQY55942.1 hypothetical protein ASD11_15760 [Aeromicrobium sp. Root495]
MSPERTGRGNRKSSSRTTSDRPGLLRRVTGTGPWWSKVLRWALALGTLGIVGGALTFFLLYRFIEIPDANADFETQTTKVFYSDGKTPIGSFALQDRESVSLDQVPAVMQSAVIAAEDRSFYENKGLDLKGILRAVKENTTSGQVTSGGSTITQQYVKVLYLTQERSYKRKIREAVLSVKIHNQLSKKEILEGYLNTIYFGNRAYGVQVAARTYFGKSASELNFPQAAALATIINNPSYYDPYSEGGLQRMVPRYNYVLDGMLKDGAITQEQHDKFAGRLPKFDKLKSIDRFGGTKGYLLSLVKRQMRSQAGFDDAEVDGGGLRIVTTFDKDMQKDAVDAVKQVRPGGLDELHTALVSVQPGTGAVRALYGGPDYLKSQNNWATLPTQPGSTFKAFAVIAGLEDGYSLKTKLNGSSPFRIGSSVIENQGDSGGESFGTVPLEFATQKSINTAFIDLVQQMSGGKDADISVGAKKVLEAANQAGIPKSVTDKIEPFAVTPLGYAPVPPIDMANAYATIAAEGKRADWFVIRSVKNRSGEEIYRHKVKTEQAIPEDVAADTLFALQRVTAAGTGMSGRTICPTAGKTGTATAGDDDDQHVSSSWFLGATPKLATAVMYNRGVGNEDLEGYLNPFFGGTYPALTFKAYMDAALVDGGFTGADCGTFPRAANIKADKGTTVVPAPRKTSKPKPKPSATVRPTPTPTRTTPQPTEPTVQPSPEPTTTATPCVDNNGALPPNPCRD